MAKRRMFSLDIVDTDIFLDMPPTTQNLYFHLGMRADDDGFVAAPKKIAKLCNSTPDDIKILVAKGYIIPFDDGVVLVTDWMINNQIRKDRYTETRFKEHLNSIESEDGRYKKSLSTKCQPNGNQMATKWQPSIGKDSIGEHSEGVLTNDNSTKDDNNNIFNTTSTTTVRRENNQGDEERKFTPPTLIELMEYKYCYPKVNLYKFFEHYDGNGWIKKDGSPVDSLKALKTTLTQCNIGHRDYI